jgi:hypothetical protein
MVLLLLGSLQAPPTTGRLARHDHPATYQRLTRTNGRLTLTR